MSNAIIYETDTATVLYCVEDAVYIDNYFYGSNQNLESVTASVFSSKWTGTPITVGSSIYTQATILTPAEAFWHKADDPYDTIIASDFNSIATLNSTDSFIIFSESPIQLPKYRRIEKSNALAVINGTTITATGGMGIAATQKIYFDGVAMTGHTHISESSNDNLRITVGNTALVNITPSQFLIGATSESTYSSTFHVTRTSTDTAAAGKVMSYLVNNVVPASDSASYHYSLLGVTKLNADVNFSGTNNYGGYFLTRTESTITSGKTVASITGCLGQSLNYTTGTLTAGVGVWGSVGNHAASGTFTSAYGVRSSIYKDTGMADISTGYLFYGAISGCTTEWGIYLTGETNNTVSGNLMIGTTTVATGTASKILIFGDNGGDPTPGTNTAAIYAKDVTGTVELYTCDEAGNDTLQTPHTQNYPEDIEVNLDFPQVNVDSNKFLGIKRFIAMCKMAELVQQLSWDAGLLSKDKRIVAYEQIDKLDWDSVQSENVKIRENEIAETIKNIQKLESLRESTSDEEQIKEIEKQLSEITIPEPVSVKPVPKFIEDILSREQKLLLS